MSTAVVLLIVTLRGYPGLPGVIVSVHDTERECLLAAQRNSLALPYAMKETDKFKWRCEVRT